MEPGLAGDVLLLAVVDGARFRTAGGVDTVLAGALLCGEAMGGRLLPARPAGKERRSDLEKLVRHRSATAVEEASRPLVLSGVLVAHTHRALGLFPRHGFRVLETWPQWQAEQRLRSALRPGSRPDPGSAALAVLCAVSGIARAVQPAPARKADRKALAAHLNGLAAVVGPDVTDVLLATRAVYRRRGAGDGFAADDDGYGDSSGDGGGGDSGGGGD